MKAVSRQIEPYLLSQGGPIIALQVENEFSESLEHSAYILSIRDVLLKEGIVRDSSITLCSTFDLFSQECSSVCQRL